jgi:prepilin-type N-terminal cleavage/methylation domain-containing protein
LLGDFPKIPKPLPLSWQGFTLAELLVSLLILGEIATFTIPKILTSQQEAQKKAIFKETIATVFEITRTAALDTSQVATPSLMKQHFRNNLNYTKECVSNLAAEGCLVYGDSANTSGFVLTNGAVILSINGVLQGRETIAIDWNGSAGPNLGGDDLLWITACFGPTDCDGGTSPILLGPTRPGAVGPSVDASYVALWREIFE